MIIVTDLQIIDRSISVSFFTIFTLSIQTPQLLTILNLKFEKYNLQSNFVSKIAGWEANSVDPDEMPCLRRLILVYTFFAQACQIKYIQ